MRALAKHLLVELHGCGVEQIRRADLVKDAMLGAARAIRCTIVESSFHEFSPNGVSGVVVIAESHFSIHTWPEFRYAAVDIFTGASSRIGVEDAIGYLKKHFRCKSLSVMEVKRGIFTSGSK